MFIQTEPTPNPATLKFIPGRVVLDAVAPRHGVFPRALPEGRARGVRRAAVDAAAAGLLRARDLRQAGAGDPAGA